MPSGRGWLRGLAALLLVAATVGGLLQLRLDTSPQSFLPENDPSLASLRDTARSFGGDPIVVLARSKEPRHLLSAEQLPKLLKLEGKLSRLRDVSVVYGPATVLNQLAGSAQNLLAELSGQRDGLRAAAEARAREAQASEAEIKQAGDAATREFDRRYGSLLVRGLPAGLPTLRNNDFVNTVIFSGGTPRPQWRFVVPSQNSVALLVRPQEALDQAGTQRLVDSVRASARQSGLDTSKVTLTGVPTVAAAVGESAQRELPLLGVLGVLGIACCLLLVPWLGSPRYRVAPILITLGATALTLAGFGWLDRPLSLGVVPFLPILLGIASDFPAYLPRTRRVRQVLVAACASAVSFGAMAVSSLPFVRDLGLALGAGVLFAVALAYLLRRRLAPGSPPVAAGKPDRFARLGRGTRWTVLGGLVAVAAAGWTALPSIPVQASPQELARGLPAVEQAAEAERVLGASGNVNVVLRGNNVLRADALRWSQRVQDTVFARYGDRVHPVISAPDLLSFLGGQPTAEQIQAGVRLLPSYLTGAVISPDRQASVTVLGLELQDIGAQQQLLSQLRATLPKPPEGFSVEVTGLPVAAARAYTLVSAESYLGNILAIAAAGAVLLIGLARRRDALRAVLAAVLATGCSLAVIWLLGISLTPLTAALGSLTTATGCEFTVLLLSARRQGRPGLIRTVGVGGLAASVGYLVLLASGIEVLRQFGLLLAGATALSYVIAKVTVGLLPPADENDGTRDAASVADRRTVGAQA